MEANRTLLQGIVPMVSVMSKASSPKRAVPLAVNPAMLAVVFTAPSQSVP